MAYGCRPKPFEGPPCGCRWNKNRNLDTLPNTPTQANPQCRRPIHIGFGLCLHSFSFVQRRPCVVIWPTHLAPPPLFIVVVVPFSGARCCSLLLRYLVHTGTTAALLGTELAAFNSPGLLQNHLPELTAPSIHPVPVASSIHHIHAHPPPSLPWLAHYQVLSSWPIPRTHFRPAAPNLALSATSLPANLLARPASTRAGGLAVAVRLFAFWTSSHPAFAFLYSSIITIIPQSTLLLDLLPAGHSLC